MKLKNLEWIDLEDGNAQIIDTSTGDVIGSFFIWEDDTNGDYVIIKNKIISLSKIKEI
jgi:hypothetical protein